MRAALSKDGTPIAFDQSGQGPAIILVGGATSTRLARHHWPRRWHRILPCSPTTGVAGVRVGTQRLTRSSARSKTSKPSSTKLVESRSSMVIPPAPCWPLRRRACSPTK